MNTQKGLPEKIGQDTEKILEEQYKGLVEFITGIATSEKKDIYLSIGKVLQKCRSVGFINSIKDEWNKFKEAGKIKDGYQGTDQHLTCLQELLDFMDKENPDEIRLNAMKQIFFTAASETISDRNSVLPQQYMSICRTLSSGEILVLKACYKLFKEGSYHRKTEEVHEDKWLVPVAQKSGLKHKELVFIYDESLEEKKLLQSRVGKTNRVYLTESFRLTSLAAGICEYIEHYNGIAIKE